MAVDVCRALQLTETIPATYARRGFFSTAEFQVFRRNTLTLCEGVKALLTGHTHHISLLSESGLYKLIMRSDKKAALEFQHWIASEVLPTVRKTGKYALADRGFMGAHVVPETTYPRTDRG